MAFMQRDVGFFKMWIVEDSTGGSHLIPHEHVGYQNNLPVFTDFVEEVHDWELKEAWYSRLSAPGYLDCTDWSGPYETEEKANEALDEMYGGED